MKGFIKMTVWGVALCAACTAFGETAQAQRPSEISYNFAGLPISCSVYPEQCAIAGISGGDTIDKVEAALGMPDNFYRGNGFGYGYDDLGIVITFVDWDGTENYEVVNIISTKDLTTTDGIRAGMSASVLSEVYGQPDVIYSETETAPNLPLDLQAMYVDRNRTTYTYYASPGLAMLFHIENNIIASVEIQQAD